MNFVKFVLGPYESSFWGLPLGTKCWIMIRPMHRNLKIKNGFAGKNLFRLTYNWFLETGTAPKGYLRVNCI